jgi:hypothetical protein
VRKKSEGYRAWPADFARRWRLSSAWREDEEDAVKKKEGKRAPGRDIRPWRSWWPCTGVQWARTASSDVRTDDRRHGMVVR